MPGERFLVATPDSSQEDEIGVFGQSCQDINGRTITGGNHYVPGPDSCTVCLCDGGKPKWCQAVLCAAPKDCKSFRIGSSCCEFICLDNTEGGNDEGSIDVTWGDENWVGGDLGLRLIATAVTAVLSLALLAFLFYRLKRRRVRNHSACHELEGDTIPSSSIASFDHGDLTSSTGHLSRQPQPLMNLGENQSSIYMMWKLPNSSVTDNPPPYSENPSNRLVIEESENSRETTSLLVVPSAPSNDLVETPMSHTLMLRRSNDTLDSSDFLDAGTPPPSYAEVLACISTPAMNEIEGGASSVREDDDELPSAQWRNSLNLPRERSPAEVAIQRFSLQLALDCSDTSSCTSSSSHAQPGTLSTSSSSSAASIAHLGSN
ncbi:hypothetical protein DAPPUDRAFT_304342 [Daphnia pulex]|uniref:VWFC domain-containing protein n=1 Tax=Daphnia pulex TaxID=6669 RepID=E9GKW8_DAPPU|nr:hypothetical protein DAPPUDRAFT_304342 [Daphnia pulex]|eukprot:EFX79752.1 hypothetical protein DAPPUDRAFT_304342 [Daphnia pulex]